MNGKSRGKRTGDWVLTLISILVTAGIMALIFFFSSQNADESSDVSFGFILAILRSVLPLCGKDASEIAAIADTLQHIVRKCAHFTIFAALGASSAVSAGRIAGRFDKKAMLCAAAFDMLYAVSDEIHQCFVQGRAGMIRDVLIDTAGAVTGIFITLAVLGLSRSVKRRKVRDT